MRKLINYFSSTDATIALRLNWVFTHQKTNIDFIMNLCNEIIDGEKTLPRSRIFLKKMCEVVLEYTTIKWV